MVKRIDLNSSYYDAGQIQVLKNNNYLNLGYCYSSLWMSNEGAGVVRDSAKYYYGLVIASSDQNYQLGQANLQMGTLYNRSGNLDLAKESYLLSIMHFEKQNAIYDVLNVKFNLGVNAFESNDLEEAKSVLRGLCSEQEEMQLFDENYSMSLLFLSKVYLRLGETDSTDYYVDLFVEVNEKRTAQEKEMFSKTYAMIHDKEFQDDLKGLELEISEGNTPLFYILLGSFGIVIVIFIFLIKQYRGKKQVLVKFEALMVDVKKSENEKIEKGGVKEGALTNPLSDDQVDKILKGLKKIEEKKVYLKVSFNNYEAAKYMGTNSKYLTRVLKENYKLTFTDYLNGLRVSYLISLLDENHKIRNYTVQALAEMVGYKNGVSFSRIFKNSTGVTPFQYIQRLNDKKRD